MTEYIYDTSIEATFLREQKREEIVRCRDCKHCEMQKVRYRDEPLLVCIAEWCEGSEGDNTLVEPNGFCAWGERANFATCKCGEDIELGERESAVCPRCNRTVRA